MYRLSELIKEPVFRYFAEISKIPRASGNCEAISAYVEQTLRDLGVDSYRDAERNVIARVKAAPGYENAPVVMLQGHLDMVAAKDADSAHDFNTDPLTLIVEGDTLHADGTTLGADDGVAVAMMLAIAEDKTLIHPELELVFTTDEETGMFGAAALDLSHCKAKYLLNLDDEAESVFTVSCAGGARFNGEIPLLRTKKTGTVYELEIRSRIGGHSGTSIHLDRPNTNIVAARLLSDFSDLDPELGLLSIDGGLADNAIPTRTILRIMTEASFDLAAMEAVYRAEFNTTDDNVTFTVLSKKENERADVVSGDCLQNLLFFLSAIPNGALDFNHALNGLTETSLNFGIFETNDSSFIARTSTRSMVMSKIDKLLRRLVRITEKAGGTYFIEGKYPSWAYKKESKLRDAASSLWNEMYPEKPARVIAIHAGLECGILLGKMPWLDIIAFGPTANDVHTSKESLNIPSLRRVKAFTVRLLEEMAKW